VSRIRGLAVLAGIWVMSTRYCVMAVSGSNGHYLFASSKIPVICRKISGSARNWFSDTQYQLTRYQFATQDLGTVSTITANYERPVQYHVFTLHFQISKIRHLFMLSHDLGSKMLVVISI